MAEESEETFEDNLNLASQFNNIFRDILQKEKEELLALTSEQLRKTRYYFRWNDEASIEQNTYEFAQCLQLYQSSCRQWEQHHNGHIMVVERVRQQYLMPAIEEFLEHLKTRIIWDYMR